MAEAPLEPVLINVELEDRIGPGLDAFPAAVQRAIEAVVADTAKTGIQRIRDATPEDTGTAEQGWEVKPGPDGLTRLLTNSVPYIRVLEYGGYPVIPRSKTPKNVGDVHGKAYLGGGYPPGPRTRTAPGGDIPMLSNVSFQLKGGVGMTRMVLQGTLEDEFVLNLEEAIDQAFADLA